MTTYNTGNPVPSTEVKDLYDNAENLDNLVNGSGEVYPDRLGVPRLSWAGLEARFQDFLDSSGYAYIGDYDSGPLEITARNQIFAKDGEFWRASAALTLPYTTIENWAVDQANFDSVGDAVLRYDLAQSTGASLVGYGTGTVEDALNSQGVSLDSYPGADDDAKMAAAVADLTGTGRALRIPSRVVALTAPVVVEGFRIVGQGTYDWQQVTRWGSVFSLGGALNSSSSNVFTVSDGGAIEGCVFYYPSQVPNVSTPAITPSGYVIYIDGVVTQRGATVANNWIVNGYNCIKNDDGTSKITGNWICALNEGITDTQYLTEHHIAFNSIGFVNWFQSIGQPIRDYIGANAIAFRMIASAATLTANHVFGVRDGIRLEGPFPFLSVNGGIYDGCRFTIRGIAGCGNGELRCSNAYLASNTVVFGNNTTSAAVTLESNCVRFDDPTGGDVDLIFSGCKIGGANGHLFRVSAATGKVNLVVNGNKIVNPGRFAHTLLIGVSGVTGTFQNGETVTSGGASATFLKLDGSTMYVSSDTGTFVVAGTITGGTSGATATITSVTDGAVYYQINYNCPNGDLTVNGNDFSFARYRFNGGILVQNAKDVRVAGNGFTSPFGTSREMLKIENARSLVEGFNTSDTTGSSFADLTIVAVTREPVAGTMSAWTRRTGAVQSGHMVIQAAIATPQAFGATLATVAFDNELVDSRGVYNPATGIYTAVEAGLVDVDVLLAHDATGTAGDRFNINIVSTLRTFQRTYTIAAQANTVTLSQSGIEVRQGDTIRIQVQRATGSGSLTTQAIGSGLRIVRRH